MSDYAYNLERCLVHLIVEKMAKKKLKHKPTAELAWPHLAGPSVAWRSIRNTTATKRPQRITISDAASLCETINESFPELVTLAKTRVDDGWRHEDHDVPKEDKD